MANKIQVKRSAVPSKVPTTSDLDLGEIAINTYDGVAYIKKDNGTASIVPLGGGSGDVVGPSSATDNALVRFDGTTGKLVQNGIVTQDDGGNLNAVTSIGLDTTPSSPLATQGALFWDVDYNTLSVQNDTDVHTHVGQQMYFYVKASSAITAGDLCYFTGVVGASGVIQAAPAGSGITVPDYIIGIAAESIALNGFGYVQTFGILKGINTSAWSANDILYYDPASGGMTNVYPTSGIIVTCAAVVNSSNGAGILEIRPTFSQRITAGTGISVSQSATGVTVGNTGVTSVSGTSPVASSGGATPAISLSSGYGDTQNPYASKTANYVLAAPNGSAGVPTFRAIVAADVPTLNQNTTGSAATLTTGRTIAITGDLSYTSPSFNGSANVTAAGTLATVNANVGSFTNASITVNGKGLITAASSGTAPVTSVTGTSPVASSGGATPAISLSSGYGDTQNPYASKTANYFLSAPNGAAGAPSFRAIVAADIPTLNQNTTGTASNVTGTVAIANGGSGQTTAQAAMNAFAGAVTSGSYLRGNGTNVVMSTIQAADVPTLNQNTTGSAATLTTGRTIAITGDLSYTSPSFNGSGNVTAAGTLATVNANVGSFTNASITVNAKGLITAASSGAAAGTVTSVGGTGTVSGLSLSGTVTTSGNLTLGGNLTIAADMIYDQFTATASQTTFTTSTTYTSGKIEVYVNGVKIKNGTDCTVTSGTSVVMASGLPVNTIVDLVYPT